MKCELKRRFRKVFLPSLAFPQCHVMNLPETLQGFPGSHDGNTPNFSQCEHMLLVARDDQVRFSGDCCGQNRAVLRVGRQVHAQQLVKDESARSDVLDNGLRFIGAKKPL